MRVFITGITGTLGTELARYHAEQGDIVSGCCRSEHRMANWIAANGNLAKAYLGDCLTLDDPTSDIHDELVYADHVYHCAALKHVDICERQPVEAYRQNLRACDIVSRVCQQQEIGLTFISTDKACLPQGVYGATKLLGERIVISRGGAVVRFGNLIGSSGSVFQKWAESARRKEPISLTDYDMTRYFISTKAAARFAAENSLTGFVRIPNMKAAQMGHIARALQCRINVIGRRPGETQHQWLVAPGESLLDGESSDTLTIGPGKTVVGGLSSQNAHRWSTAELLQIAGC